MEKTKKNKNKAKTKQKQQKSNPPHSKRKVLYFSVTSSIPQAVVWAL